MTTTTTVFLAAAGSQRSARHSHKLPVYCVLSAPRRRCRQRRPQPLCFVRADAPSASHRPLTGRADGKHSFWPAVGPNFKSIPLTTVAASQQSPKHEPKRIYTPPVPTMLPTIYCRRAAIGRHDQPSAQLNSTSRSRKSTQARPSLTSVSFSRLS
uniref:Uncharacterized protein n=1 Tax=Plectus sambesii TaxID=2011161 RepID=A0A914UU78_9BILA